MRVLFSTTAGVGHFGPLIPVARAGANAGWDVAVAAPIEFRDTVRGTGLVHLPFASPDKEQIRAVFAGLASATRPLTDRTVLTEVFGRLDAQAALPGLTAIVHDWAPDLLVREPCEFGSLAAATAAGIAQVDVAIGMGRLGAGFRGLMAEAMAELEAMAGLPADVLVEPSVHRATITSVPASLDASEDGLLNATFGLPPDPDPGPVWRHRTAVAPSAELPSSWGDVERPLVYVTFGSVLSGMSTLHQLFRRTVDLLADLPIRALMTTGHGFDATTLDPLPPNFRVEAWWPQAQVMPAAAAAIGHGGFGTTMTALAAGVPQIVIPLFAADQHQHADQIARSGAGVALGGPEDLDRLPGALSAMLTDGNVRAKATGIAADIAGLPEITSYLTDLESLTAT